MPTTAKIAGTPEWKEIEKLLPNLDKSKIDALRADLRRAVSIFKPAIHRRTNQESASEVREVMALAIEAVVNIKLIEEAIGRWDKHTRSRLYLKFESQTADNVERAELDVTRALGEASLLLVKVAKSIHFSTRVTLKSAAHRPRLPYENAALELIRLWDKHVGLKRPKKLTVTGSKRKTKRKTRQGFVIFENGENGTQFGEYMYLCLKLIDPQIERTQARTCTKRAAKKWPHFQEAIEKLDLPASGPFSQAIFDKILKLDLTRLK